MKKPSIELQQKYFTNYPDKSIFFSNARLLQSIWREENHIPLKCKYGNYLDIEQAYSQELNFLTPKIREIVKNEVELNRNRKGKDKKVISKKRLYENLLSSQPLAFNLFAELITNDFELANIVLKQIFPNRILNITSIEFEVSTCRGDIKYTGDHSAFDVFIRYKGLKGNGFIGIEVKYSEHLLDNPASFKETYKRVAIQSGKFTEKGIAELCGMPKSLEQIWRDHLLSLSLLPPINTDFEEGLFVFLYPKDNQECANAFKRYTNYLKSPIESGIESLYMEDFISILKQESSEKWISDFEDRYLRFEKIYEVAKQFRINQF